MGTNLRLPQELSNKCPLCKGIGDKIYKKGHLVHLALASPPNPRTEMEIGVKIYDYKTTRPGIRN
jgi:hypothetical protein